MRLGTIPRRYTTRIGGKVFMTGAGIAAVIADGTGVDPAAATGPAHRRRGRGAA